MEKTTPPAQEPKQKRDKLFLFLFLFMTLVAGTFAWLFWTKEGETQVLTIENVKITSESEVVKKDLQQLQEEYAALETNDAALQQQIDEKKQEIEALQLEAEQHKDDQTIIDKLKRETKTLRAIMKHFVGTIDSLNVRNKILTAEKDSVTTELHVEKDKRSSLQSEKDKLYQIGSIIKTSGMTVAALNVKSKTRENETKKARRVDKIKIAFKLGENQIATPGERTIYVRVVTPEGKEWCESTDESHMFSFGKGKGFYAMKKSIIYSNEDLSLEMFLKKEDSRVLLPGKYMVDVCMDNVIIGSSSLLLE